MGDRLGLQALLVSILGSNNVYFQPPPNVVMSYPCIVYSRDQVSIAHADNKPYKNKTRYQVTVIDPEPDSDIPKRVAQLPTCAHRQTFVVENLNHDVYTLFF